MQSHWSFKVTPSLAHFILMWKSDICEIIKHISQRLHEFGTSRLPVLPI